MIVELTAPRNDCRTKTRMEHTMLVLVFGGTGQEKVTRMKQWWYEYGSCAILTLAKTRVARKLRLTENLQYAG